MSSPVKVLSKTAPCTKQADAYFVSGKIIALFVVFGILAIAFGIVQIWKQDNATVPPRILKQRSIAFGSWFVFCLGGSFFVLIYYIPIWFQAIKDTSAVGSGIRNLPMILGLVIVSIIAGIAITSIGYYTPAMILCRYSPSHHHGLDLSALCGDDFAFVVQLRWRTVSGSGQIANV